MGAQPAREASGPRRISLAAFNGLAEAEARRLLTACCAAQRWVAEVAAGRPFGSVDAVLRRSDAAVAGLTQADLEQALSGHPRIGASAEGSTGGASGGSASGVTGASAGVTGASAGGDTGGGGGAGAVDPGAGQAGAGSWSGREQAGVDRDDRALMQALADGNREYERRFGHIYLVCASGRSGAELLALLRGRLGNDPDAEWRVVRSELEKINRIRLERLLREGAADRETGAGAEGASEFAVRSGCGPVGAE